MTSPESGAPDRSPPEQQFQTILAAARTGAEWAWRLLYRELSPAVHGYLRAQGAQEPEDLAAEVFVQLVRSLPAFEGDRSAFRSWVFVIAHRKLVDEGRRRRRRTAVPLPPEDLERHGRSGDAEAEALGSLGRAEIERLLDTLTPSQQQVLLLRVVADLSIGQTARVVGRRPGAVEALQHRALARLRRQLQRPGGAPRG